MMRRHTNKRDQFGKSRARRTLIGISSTKTPGVYLTLGSNVYGILLSYTDKKMVRINAWPYKQTV